MDAEGGQVIRRERRASRLAVVVAVQNVLVVACLVVTLFMYWELQGRVSSTDVENYNQIQVYADSDISRTGLVRIYHHHNRPQMDLKNNTSILVSCTGPYLVHLELCYKDLNQATSSAVLSLTPGKGDPVCSFNLNATNLTCRGFHNTVDLRAGQQISVHLTLTSGFKMTNMTLGFRYLLGEHCES